jgi:hypothetical protein
VHEPDRLVAECVSLASQQGIGRVASTNWPPSIQTLNPRHVFVNRGYVVIVTATGIGPNRGYLVITEGAPPADMMGGRDAKPTEDARILAYADRE